MQGVIFKYKTKDGIEQKAVAVHNEQTREFSDYRKAFLRLLNDDLTEKKDNEGKKK
jgi:hypothetical protein